MCQRNPSRGDGNMTEHDTLLGRREALKKGALATSALVIGSTAATGTAAAGIGEGRVGHYPLNNIRPDGTVHDASPEGNDGTNNGASVVRGGGKVGNAFEFNDAYVVVPKFPNITSSLTIAAWMRTSDIAEIGQRVFADDENNDGGYALSVGDGGRGTVRFYNRSKDTVSLDTGSVITADSWYHVAGIYDDEAKSRRIYVDGEIEAEIRSDTGPWGADAGTASIGGETDSGETEFRFNGLLDEVRVYDRALSQSEIQSLAAMGGNSGGNGRGRGP